MRLRIARCAVLDDRNTTVPRYAPRRVGREEDDRAAARSANGVRLLHEETVRRRLRDLKTAADVRSHHPEDEVRVHFEDISVSKPLIRRVIDENVESPRLLLNEIHKRLNLRLVADIARLCNDFSVP